MRSSARQKVRANEFPTTKPSKRSEAKEEVKEAMITLSPYNLLRFSMRSSNFSTRTGFSQELDERKKQVAERLVKRFVEIGMGIMYQDPEYLQIHSAGITNSAMQGI